MKMDATMPPQPPLNGWTFVRAQVVQDDVDRLIDGCGAIDLIEKADELLGVSLRPAVAQDGPIEQPQRGIQTGRAMAEVIVRLPLGHAGAERQDGPRPIQRLNPALFIDAEDHRFLRRIEIEPDDIPQLVNKMRIFRQFESRDAMGLQAILMPNVADRLLALCGVVVSVACTMPAIFSGVIRFRPPGRGASRSTPLAPVTRYRRIQSWT